MSSIAIFGGSFDPPHSGHIAIIKALVALTYIDKIFIVPTYLNPFKSGSVAPSSLRLRWLREILKEYPKCEVSDFEVSLGRSVATIETVLHFAKTYSKIYVVIGSDNLASLHKWHRYDELKSLVEFLVVTRDNIFIPQEYNSINIDDRVSSRALRESMLESKLPQVCTKEISKFYKEHFLQKRLENIVAVLDKNKAEDIEVFDLRDKNYMADSVVMASSLGQKHTLALLDHLKRELKRDEKFYAIDESDNWIVADLGDILIHIMTPEFRVKYDIESFLAELMATKSLKS